MALHIIETNVNCKTATAARETEKIVALCRAISPETADLGTIIVGSPGVTLEGNPGRVTIKVFGGGALLRDVVTALDHGGYLD
jgi:hypothetical protein